ncbi:DEAD/DEAH box helicase [Natranaerobius thermophilus]|uniref:DEAD/DEAH box helicase domain protein n=1 Tax=Natranaerobius thermophilus (strain ATCC BAA-1301 / DSM 18059 / JW/NM-WN-LF) TaxID=457570 RepID=B2A401_NATTJ|nr:DEAD/DEAH box helicase [Natranaerobius thermophilus]ACB85103.1 DEAD/DEAH box helicase domain protein [Natranaerobius thermophilus JW/NM-WN-LF]
MSETFYLLSERMQKKIWEMGWDEFTPVQDKTIPIVMNTNKDVVVSSGTASGKTEAVFLPILSQIEKDATKDLKILYISPLKALINDQFERIIKLCEKSYIPIHRWHGDVNQNKKKQLTKNPAGILQITPESIESLFINRTNELNYILSDIEFIIIDELHAFLDNERGVHLRSLLSRLENYIKEKPRYFALSATLNNFKLIKEWINYNDIKNVEIIDSNEDDKDLLLSLMHFDKGKDYKKPIDLYQDLRELTKNVHSLIFCNSRAEVEETTLYLNRLANREVNTELYLAHHSSIDKKEREYVEKTMANSKSPKSVVTTSSLELGIDIGAIDYVVQIDDTHTVSSLKQRLGRSGRKLGTNQVLQVYSTTNDSLVQSLAVIDLLLEKWIEPATEYPLPLDILFHQIISICHEANGVRLDPLIDNIKANAAFYKLKEEDINHVINYMIENDFLQLIRNSAELIVGLEGERLLRGKEFYAVFMTQEEFEVREGIRKIGSIDKSLMVSEGDNIILAGQLWTIKNIDIERDIIYVAKAVDGKPPKYSGGGFILNPKIPERMHKILCERKNFEFIDNMAQNHLEEQRKPFELYNIKPNERVIWNNGDEILFETYTGTKIFQTLAWILRSYNVNIKEIDGIGRINIEGGIDLPGVLQDIKETDWRPEYLLDFTLEQEKFKSKFSPYLPKDLQDKMHIAHLVDIEGVKTFLENKKIKEIKL